MLIKRSFAALLALLPVWAQAQLPAANPLRTLTDVRVDTTVRGLHRRTPLVGLSIGILRNDSLFVYSYGETRRGNGQLPTENTLFEIGSISKTFTATLLADAVQRKLVRLDDPVSRYLPDSLPPLRKDSVNVTLKMLSNHTAGLTRLPANLFSPLTDITNPYKHYDRKALYAYLMKPVYLQTPGLKIEYSNLGVGLLGTLLENVTGKTYQQLLEERITGPLRLTRTAQILNEDQQKAFAQGHSASREPVSRWDFQSLAGAGGIRSTVTDLITYLKAEMGIGPAGLVRAMRLTQQPTARQLPRMVGLGWFWRNESQPWYWHNGGTGGFMSFAAFNPSKKLAVVVLSNAQISVDTLGIMLLSVAENKL